MWGSVSGAGQFVATPMLSVGDSPRGHYGPGDSVGFEVTLVAGLGAGSADGSWPEQAGVDSGYQVRLQDDDDLRVAASGAVAIPVNATAHPVKPDPERFPPGRRPDHLRPAAPVRKDGCDEGHARTVGGLKS